MPETDGIFDNTERARLAVYTKELFQGYNIQPETEIIHKEGSEGDSARIDFTETFGVHKTLVIAIYKPEEITVNGKPTKDNIKRTPPHLEYTVWSKEVFQKMPKEEQVKKLAAIVAYSEAVMKIELNQKPMGKKGLISYEEYFEERRRYYIENPMTHLIDSK